MPKLGPKFVDRIKEQVLPRVEQRIRKELAPAIEAPDAPEEEQVPQDFLSRMKRTVTETVSKVPTVQKYMLDPSKSLDLATIKWRARYAGQKRLLVWMTYNGHPRHVEIYSWRYSGKNKALRLYGHCRIHDQIHSFNPNKIQGFTVTNAGFSPRWRVEV